MDEQINCMRCRKPTALRCSRCKSVKFCSKACQKATWRRHKPDCDVIVQGRLSSVRTGVEIPVVNSVQGSLLSVTHAQAETICAITDRLRASCFMIEIDRRIQRGDPTLPSREKVRFYREFLQAFDSSSADFQDQSVAFKMILNRYYNTALLAAMEELQDPEYEELLAELERHRIGFEAKRRALAHPA